MKMKDEIGAVNGQHWARMVREECEFTRPWLNLNRDLLHQYGVFRVLKPKGMYRVCFTNPATEFVDWNSWDGEGYRITKPYRERVEHNGEDGATGSIQFRHYMADIFNGLIEEGLSIQQVEDSPRYFVQENAKAEPGSWEHRLTYVGGFAVVAGKG